MKKTIIFLLGVILSTCVYSQVATWMVHPDMDKISLDATNKVFICERGDSIFVWTTEGKCIVKTTEKITSFREGITILYNPENGGVSGFSNRDGAFKRLARIGDQCKYVINEQTAFFSHGLLLVKDTEDGVYYYINKRGETVGEGYLFAYPFQNRCASVIAYQDVNKRKGPYYKLINTRFSEIFMTKNGKPLKSGSFDFISSVSDDKQAVCIDGKSVFLYDNNTDDCTALSTDNSFDKKTFVQLLEKNTKPFVNDDDELSFATDKGTMFFNVYGQFVSAEWEKQTKNTSNTNSTPFQKYMRVISENSLHGLAWNYNGEHNIVVPCQFDAVSDIFENLAIIHKNGKYGVISVDNVRNIKVDFADASTTKQFKSPTIETALTVQFPGKINHNDIESITCEGRNGCDVMLETQRQNVSSSGSKFTYNCILHSPFDLKETASNYAYPFYIKYQGLKSILYNAYIDAVYQNNHDIRILNTSLIGDTICIDLEAFCTDDSLTQRKISVTVSTQDTVSHQTNKLNGNRYLIKIFDINNRQISLTFFTNEEGLPNIPHNYNVFYTPAIGKKRGTIEVKRETIDTVSN